jgi:hypothetical protein
MIKHHEQEMSISQQDFYRLLPSALRNTEYKIKNNQINASYCGGSIQINPGSEHKRKIGALVLPVLYVVITFIDITSDESTQFLTSFSRAYQRGGG